jgi:hypothetical protein
MRAESERAFQTGGLAAVVEEEEMGPPAPSISPSEIVERTTGGDRSQRLSSMIIKNKEDALKRLRANRESIAQRRAAQQQGDERAKWLALAQGMLAPTRTGSFGESLGTTAGLLRQEADLRRQHEDALIEDEQFLSDQEGAINQQALSDELRLMQIEEAQSTAARARSAGSMRVYHPDDVEAVSRGEMDPADQRIVWASQSMMPDGTFETNFASADGKPLEVVSDLDPNLLARLTQTRSASGSMTDMLVADAQSGIAATATLPKLYRARELLDGLENGTSGVQEVIRGFTNFFGISADTIPDNVDLAELQNIMGQTILSELQKLTGPKSDFEYQQVSAMNASLTNDIEGNKRVLDNMISAYNRVVDEGEAAATHLGTIPGQSTYLRDRYARFREQTKPQQDAAETAARVEAARLPEPPPEAAQHLLQSIEGLGPDSSKEQHDVILNQFREIFEIPEETKVELRRLGVAI